MEEQDLKMQVEQLKKDFKDLNDEVYSNNFSSLQDFNKYSRFNTRLKVPHYDVLPNVCEVGEICEIGGKLKVCSAQNVWVTVGSQS